MVDPLVPGLGFGLSFPKDNTGAIQLTSALPSSTSRPDVQARLFPPDPRALRCVGNRIRPSRADPAVFLSGQHHGFDLYRTCQNIVQANGIVADVISRQTSIDNAFVSNLYSVFTHLQQNSTAPIALRISSIKKTMGAYRLDWTKESGTAGLLKRSPQRLVAA